MNFTEAILPPCYESIEKSTESHIDLFNSLREELFELKLDYEIADIDGFYITEDFLSMNNICPKKMPILVEGTQSQFGKLLDAGLICEHRRFDIYYKSLDTEDIFEFKGGFLHKISKTILMRKPI